MSAIHGDPKQHGVTFGDVVVTVDLCLGDCVIRAPQPGPVLPVEKRARFHSLDEMRGAYAVQQGIHQKDPNNTTARDMAKALKFAGLAIKNHQKGSK
jgi:hypothetical protein